MFQKAKPLRSRKLLDTARDAPCMYCNRTGTTVAAHGPRWLCGGGMGQKAPDHAVALLCVKCHDVVDGRSDIDGRGDAHKTRDDRDLLWLIAHARTIAWWFDMGVIKV